MFPKQALSSPDVLGVQDVGPFKFVFRLFAVKATSDQTWESGITSSSLSEGVTDCRIPFHWHFRRWRFVRSAVLKKVGKAGGTRNGSMEPEGQLSQNIWQPLMKMQLHEEVVHGERSRNRDELEPLMRYDEEEL
jgi:hypothetical protein